MADRDTDLLRALGAVALMTEVDRAAALVDIDVPRRIPGGGRDSGRPVREPRVVRPVDVVLRGCLESGELTVAKIDDVAAKEFLPLAIVNRHRRVAGRIAVVG